MTQLLVSHLQETNHKCDQQNDKTKAAYWACRLPRYAKQLGLSGGGSFFW